MDRTIRPHCVHQAGALTQLSYRPVISLLDEVFSVNLREHASFKLENYGARRDRTADPLRAKQVLSQLSYSPDIWWVWVDLNHRPHPYQGCALTN